MPGGSVNGRPFREEAASYAATGVPRGNPNRVFHHGVMRMGGSMTGKFVAPEEKIETEGEKQLKVLARKQIATDVTLKDQLKHKKDFTSGTFYKPLVQDVKGELNLKDYEELAQKDKDIEELLQCGLTKEDTELKLLSQQVPAKKRCLGMDPAIQKKRLKEIDAKISVKQHLLSKPDQFSGVKQLSRHEYDLEQSLLQSSKTYEQKMFLKFTKKAASENTRTKILNEIESEHENKNKSASSYNAMNERSLVQSKSETLDEPELTAKFCLKCQKIFKSDTDVKICNVCIEDCCADSNDSSATLCGPIKSISDEMIKSNRLNVDGIRDIPRFKDYSSGTKTKTLFVKNLATGVTEFDLVSLFGRFQSKGGFKTVYRLMTGRMKGQAFVTYESEDTAAKALELINGYCFLGKPVVIQYGKKNG